MSAVMLQFCRNMRRVPYSFVALLGGGAGDTHAPALNFLILDEPTNHLDIQSREILLAALKKITGTVILVSHDRHFLRSLVNRVFEIDHGEMRTYEGDYEYYLEKTGQK